MQSAEVLKLTISPRVLYPLGIKFLLSEASNEHFVHLVSSLLTVSVKLYN